MSIVYSNPGKPGSPNRMAEYKLFTLNKYRLTACCFRLDRKVETLQSNIPSIQPTLALPNPERQAGIGEFPKKEVFWDFAVQFFAHYHSEAHASC